MAPTNNSRDDENITNTDGTRNTNIGPILPDDLPPRKKHCIWTKPSQKLVREIF